MGLWFRTSNLFNSFSVLTNALGDPTTIGGKTVDVLTTMLKYSYTDLLPKCSHLTLGNPPQGRIEVTCGVCRLHPLSQYVATIKLNLKSEFADNGSEAEHRSATLSDLVVNAIFGDTDVALSVTVGFCAVALLIHVEILSFGI